MRYDLVILGAGPGGYVAAIRAGQLGLKTLVVERWKVGGVCLNVGCIPTKALLHAAHTVATARSSGKIGIRAEVDIDLAKLNAWKERVVSRLVKGVEFLFKKNGVELLRGEGKLVPPNGVEVTTERGKVTVEGRKIVLATGSRPRYLKGLERDGERIWDSNDAVALREVPRSLLVVGAGAVGLEFAYIYRHLGSERVVVVDIMDQVLPGTDREMANLYVRVLKREGIEVRLETTVKAVEGDGTVVLSSKDGEVVERYDKVLVAVGRVPNTEFLRDTGIRLDGKGFVPVDDRLRTNLPDVLAIGDITPGPMLAHRAQREGVLAAEVAAGLDVKRTWRYVPAVVYTYPEYATVGLTEERAKEMGYDVAVGRFPLSASGRAQALGGVEGAVKVVAEKGSGRLLGVHILAPEASSLVSEATLALEEGATVEDIERVIHPHPTISEAFMEAAANVLKKAIHIVN